jgi:hypothetical protein
MASAEPKQHEILIRLAEARVEAIVVGMTSAVIQGVPTTTWDLDIVHRRTSENVERLLRVLEDLDAVARADPRRIRPAASHLLGPAHVLLETRFGDFGCLGTIDGNRSYDDLATTTVAIQLEGGHELRVLDLKELLAIKKRAGRAKDLAAVPYIQATIDELAARASQNSGLGG